MDTIEKLLKSKNILYRALTKKETHELNKRWFEAFTFNLNNKTGKHIYKGYRWHAYSYEFEPHLKGSKALSEYQSQPITKYFVFDESGNQAFECESKKYPDFSSNFDEVYVCHQNLKWSMVFTHEQPELGPYFAYKNQI